ncbi:MAG: hypothetical protein ACM3PY_17760 [Omnitrophica WOR_2 bacterium]
MTTIARRSTIIVLVFSVLFSGCNLPVSPANTTPAGNPRPAQTENVNPTSYVPATISPGTTETVPTNETPAQPAPSQTVAPTSTPLVSLSPDTPYAVILINKGEVLNVRETAGPTKTVIDRLQAHARKIILTGKQAMVGKNRWVEIKLSDGRTGWVNMNYLTAYIPPASFCSDDQVTTLLASFKNAILKKDGKLLASLVSPLHGLNVQYLRGGNVVKYTPELAQWLFTSTYAADWGLQPASGLAVKGSFHEEVLPRLVDVLDSSYTSTCNQPVTGGATYTYAWPYEYTAINFYSLYRPGPAGQELDWRTWLVGVEYINGKPFLFSLVHLFWEP